MLEQKTISIIQLSHDGRCSGPPTAIVAAKRMIVANSVGKKPPMNVEFL